jgi:[acyl-carrier-protein] S-malonyltransferase
VPVLEIVLVIPGGDGAKVAAAPAEGYVQIDVQGARTAKPAYHIRVRWHPRRETVRQNPYHTRLVVVLVFPGQGSQRPGMGRPWRDHPSWALVAQLSEAAGRDLAELLVGTDAEALRETRNAQLATYALSLVALDATLRGPFGMGSGTSGVAPVEAVAGHSLGEYTALVAAGALGAAEGARLVVARGEAMQEAAETNPGTMAAVLGLELEEVAAACAKAEGAWVANDNAPGQVVVAGTLAGVEEAAERARDAGAKRVVPLQVGGAFHTPLMGAAQPALDAALQAARFKVATVPLVANVDATPHTGGFAPLLSAQLCSRVRWRESLLRLAAMGARLFVELGPGTEISGMVRRALPGAARANVAGPEDLRGLGEALAANAAAPAAPASAAAGAAAKAAAVAPPAAE